MKHLFDLHCDTLTECYKQDLSLFSNNLHLDIHRGMSKYLPWVQCFAVFVPDEIRGEKAVEYFENNYKKFLNMIEKSAGRVKQSFNGNDLCRMVKKSSAKCIAMLTVEGSAASGGTIEGIRRLAECGVRIVTLTWNGRSEVGSGAEIVDGTGITEFGIKAVQEMERLGIVIDVSHASDKLFEDVAKFAKKPFIATHSNARTIYNHQRNLTDEQIRTIIKRRGLIGLNLYPTFLNGTQDASFSDIIRHMEHIISLGGVNTLCLGTDFDGADMPSQLNGIEHLYKLGEYLQKHNYTNKLIRNVFFQNAFDFFVGSGFDCLKN